MHPADYPPVPHYGICQDLPNGSRDGWRIRQPNDVAATKYFFIKYQEGVLARHPELYNLVLRGYWFPEFQEDIFHDDERVVFRGRDLYKLLDLNVELTSFSTIFGDNRVAHELAFLRCKIYKQREAIIEGRLQLMDSFSMTRSRGRITAICETCGDRFTVAAVKYNLEQQEILLDHAKRCGPRDPSVQRRIETPAYPLPQYLDCTSTNGLWLLFCRCCGTAFPPLTARQRIVGDADKKLMSIITDHIGTHSAAEWERLK